ncbi:TauD/TfdA family dioxygenase [Nonomuraea typhae]|uniref:TauD/TfdA family dioxygenase n=1 Tax=Nonomuraea typhae TaxID=2603600 RepID=A0ABW7YS71_9ACTN
MNIQSAKHDLARQGWAVLRTGRRFADGDTIDEKAVLDLAGRFGVPSSRDGGREIWPVRPTRTDPAATLSERAGAAGFHTDAAYRPDPEPVICMFVIRPAADGGRTLLLGATAVAAELRRHALGARLLDTLAAPEWRWRVPEVFGGAPAGLSPPAAVLPGDGTIRWRADNLAGLTCEQRRVASWFARLLKVLPQTVTLDHRPGDVIIIDNHRTMHARAWFRDPRRLLLRVRLWAS